MQLLVCAAYRLDIALEPGLNRFQFDESYLYTPTFSVRHGTSEVKPRHGYTRSHLPGATDQSTFTATEDASILRGVETFASSSTAFSKIRQQMLDPDAYSTVDIQHRYSSLLNMLQRGRDVTNSNELVHNDSTWNISKQESWLAPDVPQSLKPNNVNAAISTIKATKIESTETITQSRSGRKIQKRTYLDCFMN